MFFSNILSFAVIVTGLFSVALAQAPLTPGKYRIINGPQSARTFPFDTLGLDQTEITLSDQIVGIFEEWELISDGGDGFFIENLGTNTTAFGLAVINEIVVAALDNESSWLIQGAGQTDTQQDLFTIKLPNQDLLWTNTPVHGTDNLMTLQGSDGSLSQRFVFQEV